MRRTKSQTVRPQVRPLHREFLRQILLLMAVPTLIITLFQLDALSAIDRSHLRGWGLQVVAAMVLLAPIALWISIRRCRQSRDMKGMRVEHRQFSIQINSAPDAIFTCSAEGLILDCNKKAESMFGLSREEVIGSSIVDRLGFRDSDPEALLMRIVGESVLHRDHEVEATRADGTVMPAGVTVGFTVEDDRPLYSVRIRDLSKSKQDEEERQVLERQLNEANKMEAIGRLAGGIAHEINTPMQYIGDNLRFIEESYHDLEKALGIYQSMVEKLREEGVDETAREALIGSVESRIEEIDLDYVKDEIPTAIQQSLDGTQHIVKLVRPMKQFAHPGSESMEPTNLNETVSSTVTVCRNEWKYHADVSLEFDAFLPLVPCHASPLRQVLLNLIVNAAHAIEEKGGEAKGKIAIRTALVGEMAEIRIEDSGKGIPEEVQDRIFDPFFTTKKVGKGSGQGLAIAYDIVVRKHGGKLSFETETDVGTTFVIQIPHSPETGDEIEESATEAELVN